MIINENGWGNKPQQETKESFTAKKLKKLAEESVADNEAEGSENAEQE